MTCKFKFKNEKIGISKPHCWVYGRPCDEIIHGVTDCEKYCIVVNKSEEFHRNE